MAKTPRTRKYVYLFGNKKADGDGSMKPLLGGKGANLAEMTRIGLPVPPGFTITTEVCTYYYDNKRSYPRELDRQKIRRYGKAAARLGSLRRARFDARHDGHHS
jgi:pyruvate,orthophosphate dikinase